MQRARRSGMSCLGFLGAGEHERDGGHGEESGRYEHHYQ